jgi:FkbM family methyltransferase
MGIVSYAQNFEDVLLWRALGHIPNGFYIDIGAQHPVIDSVSKAFYEHGWRGVSVEATTTYADMLRKDRPDELVLQVAVSDLPGTMTFYEIPKTGLSTGDKSIADKHQESGFEVLETVVTCITLANVFEQAGQRDIHWLKIDVEGMEGKVLAGWAASAVRPWVLVIESTYPNTQIDMHQDWQQLVFERGYQEAYFDGLSRYYVLATHTDIAARFKLPPNIFDGFLIAPTSSYSIPSQKLLHLAEQRHLDALKQAQEDMQSLRDSLAQRERELNAELHTQSETIYALQLQLAELGRQTSP